MAESLNSSQSQSKSPMSNLASDNQCAPLDKSRFQYLEAGPLSPVIKLHFSAMESLNGSEIDDAEDAHEVSVDPAPLALGHDAGNLITSKRPSYAKTSKIWLLIYFSLPPTLPLKMIEVRHLSSDFRQSTSSLTETFTTTSIDGN